MNSEPSIIYTIGYATKPIDIFIAHLKRYNINVLADIRSVPYSKVFYDYHKEAIAQTLKQNGIAYVYLGEALGPRSKDDAHYDDCGQIQFDRLMQSELFKSGINRLQDGVQKGFTIALMCAEKDPATCHRSLLVAYFLEHFFAQDKLSMVAHIDHRGELETQQELEQRLALLNQLELDLFMTESQRLQIAYQLQCKKTSYTKP